MLVEPELTITASVGSLGIVTAAPGAGRPGSAEAAGMAESAGTGAAEAGSGESDGAGCCCASARARTTAESMPW